MGTGQPRIITTDNDKVFDNTLLDKQLMKLLEIDHRLTTAQVCITNFRNLNS